MPRRRKATRLAINAAELQVHEAGGPIAPLRFSQADQLSANRLAHKDQIPLPPDLARFFDATHLMGRVIPRILEPRRVGPG